MAISEYFRNLRQKVGNSLLQISGVAAVIHDSTGKILLQKAKNSYSWSLPAGAIEPGESPAQALVREVWEETGLKVRPQKILGVFGGNNGFRHTYPNGDLVEYTVIVFQCEVIKGILGGQDDETEQLEYFPPDKIPKLAIEYPQNLLQKEVINSGYFEWEEEWLERL